MTEQFAWDAYQLALTLERTATTAAPGSPAAGTTGETDDLAIYDDLAAAWQDDANAGMPADDAAMSGTDTEPVAMADANMVAFAGIIQAPASRRTWSDFWDGVQGTLDVAGLYPAAGIVPDGVNTAISVGRGRWGEAGMNLSAMVPILGQGTKGGQLLNKGRKLLANGGGKAGKVAPKVAVEMHHLLPQNKQFRSFFKNAGLDIEDFKIPLDKAKHRLKPDGIHTNAGGNWNKVWKEYIDKNPEASASEILEQMERMRKQFGL